jgi:hypothetical protein
MYNSRYDLQKFVWSLGNLALEKNSVWTFITLIGNSNGMGGELVLV